MMFARVKKSRGLEYLQIVENYRDDGRVRQRMILYVGHYLSVPDALECMPRDLRNARSRATKARKWYEQRARIDDAGRSKHAFESTRKEAEKLADRLERLKQLVSEHPNLCSDQHEPVLK